MTDLAAFQAEAQRKRDNWSERWRQICEERGNPIPKRKPSAWKIRPAPGTDEEGDPQD